MESHDGFFSRLETGSNLNIKKITLAVMGREDGERLQWKKETVGRALLIFMVQVRQANMAAAEMEKHGHIQIILSPGEGLREMEEGLSLSN